MSLLKCCSIILCLSLISLVRVSSADWSTFWRDDFNGNAGTFPAGWKFDVGTGWGNNQVEHDTGDPNNVSLDGKGNLRITPRRDSSGRWTSARIETLREDFRPPRGGKMAMEGRIQIPDVTGDAALGYWPAFWALGSPIRHGTSWPAGGEIDVLENVNGVNKVWGTLHCGVAPGGPCHETQGLGKNRPCPGAACTAAFHVYRFEWDETKSPKEMRWYVDGQEYNKVTSNDMDAATWDKMTNHSGYFILLNVAIGGGFPDGVAQKKTPTASTQPGHPMVVDYVAVYVSQN